MAEQQETINGAIITYFSTASAVGKTLVSINSAAELAREGYRVCLVDFDLQFGDVCNYLQLRQHGLHRCRLDVVGLLQLQR